VPLEPLPCGDQAGEGPGACAQELHSSPESKSARGATRRRARAARRLTRRARAGIDALVARHGARLAIGSYPVAPPPSLLLPLPMSLLYTPSVDNS
jgi:hypothetical protein